MIIIFYNIFTRPRLQSALSSWPRSIRWSLLRPPTTCLVLSPATLYWYTYLDNNNIIIIIIIIIIIKLTD